MSQSPRWTQQLRLEAGVSGSPEGFQEGFQAFPPKCFQQHNLESAISCSDSDGAASASRPEADNEPRSNIATYDTNIPELRLIPEKTGMEMPQSWIAKESYIYISDMIEDLRWDLLFCTENAHLLKWCVFPLGETECME